MENVSEAEVKAEFRFAPSEIHLLGQALRIPETVTCPNGAVASGKGRSSSAFEEICVSVSTE